MHNTNVYVNMTDTTPEYLHEAIGVLGAYGIMFGNDLIGVAAGATDSSSWTMMLIPSPAVVVGYLHSNDC
jgi:hypothetical protein